MKRISNYHSHLYLCGHASGTVEDYVKEAIKWGYEEIGISDHAPIPAFFVGKENHERLCLSRMMKRYEFYDEYLKELDRCILKYQDQIKIYKGIEVEFFSNHDPFYQKLYESLDYMILGVHCFPYNGDFSSIYDPLTNEEIEEYAKTCEEALAKGWFNCLAHPDLYLYRVKEFTPFHETIARRIIEAAIKNDVYVEINANGEDKYPRVEFWNIAKEYKDLKIIINNDAHCVENFHGENIKRVMKFANDNNIPVLEKMEIRPHKHDTLYIGHRGSSTEGVVNNCASGFMEGIKRDYYALECDVRVTTDKVYYIHHDSKITLTNNNFLKEDLDKNGINELASLDNFSWDELKDLRLYSKYENDYTYDYLMLFEDYVEMCKETHMKCVVEFKPTNGINEKDLSNIDGAFAIIKKYDMLKNTIVISFLKEIIEYVKDNYDCLDIALLTGEDNTNMESIDYCIKNGFSIDAYYPLVTKKMIEKMHKNNRTVNVWTLNDQEKFEELKNNDVDYITTDILGK